MFSLPLFSARLLELLDGSTARGGGVKGRGATRRGARSPLEFLGKRGRAQYIRAARPRAPLGQQTRGIGAAVDFFSSPLSPPGPVLRRLTRGEFSVFVTNGLGLACGPPAVLGESGPGAAARGIVRGRGSREEDPPRATKPREFDAGARSRARPRSSDCSGSVAAPSRVKLEHHGEQRCLPRARGQTAGGEVVFESRRSGSRAWSLTTLF